MQIVPASRRVSVVVNNFNYDRFVEQAIDSALAQTYPDCEVVVVDDGSTDRSRDIISGYGNRIVTVFKENGGQGSAFNAGFAAATGEFVCFLDADDWLRPSAAHRAVEAFESTDAIKVHWRLEIVDEQGVAAHKCFPDGPMVEGDVLDTVIEQGPLYDVHNLPPTSGNAWQRRFLADALPVPEDVYPTGADVYLHTLAPLAGPAVAVEPPQGFYRAHGGNNYWQKPLDDERITYYARRFDESCRILAERLRARGVEVDAGAWRTRNFNHVWLERLRHARDAIRALVRPGGTYILIDDQEWGGGNPLPDRTCMPFLEREGDYWGPPPSDEVARAELDRMREAGADFLFVWFSSFWWLESFPRFARHLDRAYERIVDDAALIGFRL